MIAWRAVKTGWVGLICLWCASGYGLAQTGYAQGLRDQIARDQDQLEREGYRLARLVQLRMRVLLGLSIPPAEDPARLSDRQREIVRSPDVHAQRAALLAEVEETQRVRDRLTHKLRSMPRSHTGHAGKPDHSMAAAPIGETAAPKSMSDHEGMQREVHGHGDAHHAAAHETPRHRDRHGHGDSRHEPVVPELSPDSRVVLGRPSADNARIGFSLLEAGRMMLLAAAEEDKRGRPDEAEARRKSARERLERARDALQDFERGGRKRVVEIFHLARAEELLGNRERASKLYRDVQKLDTRSIDVADGARQTYGPWALHAQFANELLGMKHDMQGWALPFESVTTPWTAEEAREAVVKHAERSRRSAGGTGR